MMDSYKEATCEGIGVVLKPLRQNRERDIFENLPCGQHDLAHVAHGVDVLGHAISLSDEWNENGSQSSDWPPHHIVKGKPEQLIRFFNNAPIGLGGSHLQVRS